MVSMQSESILTAIIIIIMLGIGLVIRGKVWK